MSDQNTAAADLGPLEPLLSDPDVTEIFVDSPDRISISRYCNDSVPLAGLSAARKAKKSCGAMVSVI